MVRQCAWCLRLIDGVGERLSSSPLPKLYEASHGICSVCGTVWIARAIEKENQTGQGPVSQLDKEHLMSQVDIPPVIASSQPEFQGNRELQEVQESQGTCETQPSITQLILDLQKKSRQKPTSSVVKKSKRLRIY
jgi:hypothetical protein